VAQLIFRKGLDMKAEVAGELAAAYHSQIVDDVRASDFTHVAGRLTIRLAREFGFCYGVDRAVDYAYQARRRFPDRNVFLTGEIIHNPHVNDRLRAAGIRFLTDAGEDPAALGPDDVLIIPAFGASIGDMAQFEQQGCTLVDTTCGSVLNVWKNVRRYAQDGFTSIIHGKVKHEETRATASQALRYDGGHYLIVLDRDEAQIVCDYIRTGIGPDALLDRFRDAVSPGFDPARHLTRVGCANQTTMLMTESLAIGGMFRDAVRDRFGEDALAERFRAFDTICSATQERQDAVLQMLDEAAVAPLDLMIVVGGYNSSNTVSLARICAERVRTFHIAEPSCLEPGAIRHRPIGLPSTAAASEDETRDWFPVEGPVTIGLTAGASTPNNIVGQVIERLASFASGAVPGAHP
jgi:4-hydroxy-3-methylbut-2-enyl diphosphate reductase